MTPPASTWSAETQAAERRMLQRSEAVLARANALLASFRGSDDAQALAAHADALDAALEAEKARV